MIPPPDAVSNSSRSVQSSTGGTTVGYLHATLSHTAITSNIDNVQHADVAQLLVPASRIVVWNMGLCCRAY